MSPPNAPHIYVLAGINGAGKSSIGGAAFRAAGAAYYNPDEAARPWMAANPALTQADANSAAWRKGVELLTRAIGERKNFAFETTLGANTIPRLLMEAAITRYRTLRVVRGPFQPRASYRARTSASPTGRPRHRRRAYPPAL